MALSLISIMAAAALSAAPSLQASPLDSIRSRADQGDPEAIYRLAYLTDTGYDGMKPDTLLSTDLYRRAAEAGYAPAQNYLGFRLYNGDGVDRDIEQGMHWISLAAQQGDPRAASNLGWLLMTGDDVVRDYEKARYWLTKAAEAGLSPAISMLGDIYAEGLGTEPDLDHAASLYRKAASRGLRDAEYKLISLRRDHWHTLPADSALSVGRSLLHESLPSAAFILFSEAAAKGSPEGYALLGESLAKGLGVAYDHDRSLTCYLTAALMGDPSARFIIGELIEVFPDALTGVKPEICGLTLPSVEEIRDPAYWYGLAAEDGILDAASATRRLLSP